MMPRETGLRDSNDDTLWLVVPAAGKGTRMRAERPKQYLDLDGQPVIVHTLAKLHSAWPQARLILCLDEKDVWFEERFVPFDHWQRINGGDERADSVLNALMALQGRAHADDWVLVHDVARPCVHVDDLHTLHASVIGDEVGGLLATPAADTMKRQDRSHRVGHTESREGLWHALTPQAFRYGLLYEALHTARQSGQTITDEASAVEAFGLAPKLVPGRRDNLKITHPEDLALARWIITAQRDNT
ncbi:2-C-methyl-D-erythritol 4-phosphate cytidylyltransferase [Phytohalomonas tamaricis]|uniref:2-C-methyl-D-erythritol 4-phosphate cytidylyltransferase n=1 Tax=Phytohalomonas tamaricis TaxID=2081032 RepID=UPI0021D4111B|nr:2-C-methyl-D-erythritol 4-phosphate cytidylyltransferase [Phytohalomonas tamaricis]